MAYYVTINREAKPYQLTFDDIINGLDEAKLVVHKDTRDTTTWKVDRISPDLIDKTNFTAMEYALKCFVEKYAHLIAVEDKSKLYYSFKIAKRSGGLRQIDAPEPELKAALYELKGILEKKFYMSYHTTAFAYVRGRCTIDSVKRHQQNQSRWFLKMDMRHFFPSVTPQYLMDMLCMTFPFCSFCSNPRNRKLLEDALSLCFLNGGLPQGTPTSPMLTNAMMIPMDHAISKYCHEHSPHLCYTRYADDILISSEFSFRWSEVQNSLNEILKVFQAPFKLNPEKTRYGSSAGRNWNLGVMLNKDNKITVGHAKKNQFKIMLHQFAMDFKSGKSWELNDLQHLLGLVSYYRMVEREIIDDILARYSEKHQLDIEATVRNLIKLAS